MEDQFLSVCLFQMKDENKVLKFPMAVLLCTSYVLLCVYLEGLHYFWKILLGFSEDSDPGLDLCIKDVFN